jgi:hypothetical protein
MTQKAKNLFSESDSPASMMKTTIVSLIRFNHHFPKS